MRTHAMEKDAHTQVYQDVSVSAANAVSGFGLGTVGRSARQGIGTHAGDSAGLCVIEMDAAGKVLVEHPKVAVTKAGDYKELSQSFTTTLENTAKVRFLLDTVIACRCDQGHVTYAGYRPSPVQNSRPASPQPAF